MLTYKITKYIDKSVSFAEITEMIPVRQITYKPDSKSKVKITREIPAEDNTKGSEKTAPFKKLFSFWKTLETPLINCKINPILACSLTCVNTYSAGAEISPIAYSKLYVPVVTFQLMIMRNYYNNQNLVFKERLTVTNTD